MSVPDERCNLSEKKCKPCEGGTSPIGESEAKELLTKLQDWKYVDKNIQKEFRFKNHYETMAFVNAVAWISHSEDHHPSTETGYNTCRVTYVTHAIGGLSENDFICAAKIERL